MNKTRKEEYADATQAALLESAQTLFAENGYHNTSVDEICRLARVTKGALYHHYRNKEDLFADLVETLEVEFVESLTFDEGDGDEGNGGNLWEILSDGVDRFLEHCLDPAYRRIVLVDAPNVLGAKRLAQIGERTATGLMRTLFKALMDHGVIAKRPVGMTVRLFLSLVIEGGLLIGESKTPTKTKREVRQMVLGFLGSLK